MAIIINGTTGISGVDGSASTPAIQGDNDTNTGYFFATDTLGLSTAGSERLRITSNGALGTNSTVRSAYGGLDICSQGATNLGTLTLGAGGGANGQSRSNNQENQFRIMTPTYADPSKMFTVSFGSSGTGGHEINYGGGTGWAYATNIHRFYTASDQTTGTGLERMRIVDNGDVRFGTTSAIGTGSSGAEFAAGNKAELRCGSSGTGNSTQIRFLNDNGEVGAIRTNGSATVYHTSSDYRRKENAVAISDGITRLKNLKPYRFNFKADSSTILDGFFAHEVSSVVPEAISGTKDEVVTQAHVDSGEKKESELGDPIYQGIDQSKLVPLLTAALQEAVGKIETLETKVAALEAA